MHDAGCLGCHAHAWRTRPAPPSDQPHVWWDTDSGEWMAWKPLEGSAGLHTFAFAKRTAIGWGAGEKGRIMRFSF